MVTRATPTRLSQRLVSSMRIGRLSSVFIVVKWEARSLRYGRECPASHISLQNDQEIPTAA